MRSKGGKVKIHDETIASSLAEDAEKQKAAKVNNIRRYSRKPAPNKPVISPDLSVLNQGTRAQEWLSEKSIKDLQENADEESKATRQLYSPLLEFENTFVKNISEFLEYRDLINLRRKELLHKQWSDDVYEPIREKIVEAMDGVDWRTLDYRKRELHRQFLEHVNKRGHVFLEDDDKNEYFAQAINAHRPAPIVVRTGPLKDPLHTLEQHRNDEDRNLIRCLTGERYSDKDLEQVRLPPLPLIPQGRHGVDSRKWLEMPLGYIESTPRHKSRRRLLGINTGSTYNFREWVHTHPNAELASSELQIPQRRHFKETPPYGKPAVEIPKYSFIDQNDWADKITNIDPFPEHVKNVLEDNKERRLMYELHKKALMEEEHRQQQIQLAQEQWRQQSGKLEKDEPFPRDVPVVNTTHSMELVPVEA